MTTQCSSNHVCVSRDLQCGFVSINAFAYTMCLLVMTCMSIVWMVYSASDDIGSVAMFRTITYCLVSIWTFLVAIALTRLDWRFTTMCVLGIGALILYAELKARAIRKRRAVTPTPVKPVAPK